jgi:hypothetical protein
LSTLLHSFTPSLLKLDEGGEMRDEGLVTLEDLEPLGNLEPLEK